MKRKSLFIVLAALGALLVGLAANLNAADKYLYTALPFLSSEHSGTAYDINNFNKIVGSVGGAAVNPRPTLWEFSGGAWTVTNLGTLPGGDYYSARSINDAGKVVGIYEKGYYSGAFYVNPGGAIADLPSPGGAGTNIDAYGVNTAGVMTGMANGSPYTYDGIAFSYLPKPAGSPWWFNAFAINNAGQVAGKGQMGIATSTPFLYTPGSGTLAMQLLGAHGGAIGLNDNGVSVGWSNVTTDGGLGHPVMWNAAGQIFDLGTLGHGSGQTNRGANAINNQGTIVGSSVTTNYQDHAFVYTAAAGIQDLNNLLLNPGDLGTEFLTEAYGINENGYIVGVTNANHPFLLTPEQFVEPPSLTPIPGGLLLLGSGLLGLVGWKGRKLLRRD